MKGTSEGAQRVADATDQVASGVREEVRQRPWVEPVGQVGWVAKGVVYLLFGLLATQIARHRPEDDDASPAGALSLVMEQPGGRLILGVLTVGLALYCCWRVLSVAVISSDDLSGWAHRIGYAFSAAFYGLLTYTAFRAVQRGADSGEDNTVERVSRALMEGSAGRVLVGIGGVVTIAIGLYFVVRKGVMRSFTKSLRGVDARPDEPAEWAIVVAGVVGWIGRGIVTVLVGFLVTRAAIRFDPDDARGFDGALRKAAESGTGEALVWLSAVGLVLYGAFCILSHRRRRLEDDS